MIYLIATQKDGTQLINEFTNLQEALEMQTMLYNFFSQVTMNIQMTRGEYFEIRKRFKRLCV